MFTAFFVYACVLKLCVEYFKTNLTTSVQERENTIGFDKTGGEGDQSNQ